LITRGNGPPADKVSRKHNFAAIRSRLGDSMNSMVSPAESTARDTDMPTRLQAVSELAASSFLLPDLDSYQLHLKKLDLRGYGGFGEAARGAHKFFALLNHISGSKEGPGYFFGVDGQAGIEKRSWGSTSDRSSS